MTTTRWWRIIAILMALSLVATAGSDDDDTATDDPANPADNDDGNSGDGGEINMDEELEIAEGTVLSLPDCPPDWDSEAGLSDDTITVGMSLPESGPLAALGTMDDGMRAWFDYIEPIDGRRIQLDSVDDAYDPARTLNNVQDALETNEPFAFTSLLGTANNLAVRDPLHDECIPQLFNATGLPAWGDPETYPWTIGGLLPFHAEAKIWCNYIEQEMGTDTTVAALYMDNDFGSVYDEAVRACADEGQFDLVETATHDPAAPDITDELTTLAASAADVVLLGTTGAACPQAMAVIAGSNWDPETFLSYTCQFIPAYFAPIDPAGEGVIVATAYKEPGQLDDEAVTEVRQVLEDAGLNPDEGSYFVGVALAQLAEQTFRAAAEMEGGLNRVNVMRAVWNADISHPLGLNGATTRTDGANDAYLAEASLLARYVPPAEGERIGRYEPISDLIELEGQTGSVTRPGAG